ncbi:CRISPR-associated helicase Cas3' [Trichocoleus sp. Lan]|uniref:CRISPR-associated helicase Cas3' n=1 Tax=Trichocoleus sp. Lan TaxID=2933927 RepID=UPI0032980E40
MNEKFWAKTGQGEFQEDGSPKYHPVICHLADTAAVAMEIVRHYLSRSAIARLEMGLGLKEEALIRCCGFLAGCHDLGKVSPAFQFQVPEVGKILAGESLYDLWSSLPRELTDRRAPHGIVTAATLPDFLLEAGIGSKLSERLAKRLARKLSAIVGGHHGFFPSAAEIKNLDRVISGTEERSSWRQFSKTIFEQLQSFVGLTADDLPIECSNAAAMLLAGLTTVSDWIASNAECFPYADDKPFEDYAEELSTKAKAALTKMGWTQLSTGQPLTFNELFPSITELRPLQQKAIAIAPQLEPPCLVLVEASMGEGKTEVALYLADTLQHQASAGGFYIGLPTQATSNAMWKRVEEFLKQRYPQETVNLTLSHSAAALKTDYLKSVCRLNQVYDEEKRVVASEWHTARKRTLLSPYGVGTLDQGLMGVVRSRHQFVRLFGLAGRVVIIDEIHAYDIYTSTLLERFLEWAAVLGSPVIALSATLPAGTRKALVNAYARGCGDPEPEFPTSAYPRITAMTQGKVTVQTFNPSSHVQRSLQIQWVADSEWMASLQRLLKDGGCVAVICSTVGRAQKVFQRLQAHFPAEELGLFHGRFLFIDREQIEADCLQKFGKEELGQASSRPHRFILVATQVIEQSLDVDFDLMISDLAPIDLLLQRSGRLHRHDRQRPSLLKQPTLWLVEPTLNEKGKAQFSEAGIIYDRHVLLRTWLRLRHQTTVGLPEETDRLIEAVYDLDAVIPTALEAVHVEDWQESLEIHKREERELKETKANKVKIPPPIEEIDPEQFTRQGEQDDDKAITTLTRLGRPSITVVFLQKTESGLILPRNQQRVDLEDEPDLEQIRELLAHSTRIATQGLVEKLAVQPPPITWKSALLRHCRYVVLNAEGMTQVGEWLLRLDEQLGVVIERLK